MNILNYDTISCITYNLNAISIYNFSLTNKELYNYKYLWIASLVRSYWKKLFSNDSCFKEQNTFNYNLIDLLRLEAWVLSPLGNCVSCLKYSPLKLGSICIDCVGNRKAFITGLKKNNFSIRCSPSHSNMVFTCLLCDTSMCYKCLFEDNMCGFCKLISEKINV